MESVLFFRSAAEFHHWLENNPAAKELWVGFYKKGAPQNGITYDEAVDEALCFGWIDGVRKRVDDTRFMIRFTPRKPKSIWSEVNLRRMETLLQQGRVQPAGQQAFEARDQRRTRLYSYENEPQRLDTAEEAQLRANPSAWHFFQAQPPSYQRSAYHWVTSARKAETRQKRLAQLIEDSANGRRLAQFARP